MKFDSSLISKLDERDLSRSSDSAHQRGRAFAFADLRDRFRSSRSDITHRLSRFRSSGLSFLLRLASLVGKFGLSLYMTRYMSLDDVGIYGLIFSFSMIAVVFYGGRIDYDLTRQIVATNKVESYSLLRDQSIFLLINYIVSIPLILISQHIFHQPLPVVLFVFLICWLESYSNLLFVNTTFVGKPILANTAFFVRSGLWSIMVIVAGLGCPLARNLWFVLAAWAAGATLSIALNLWCLEVTQWPSPRSIAVDWARLRTALRRSFPIWIGSLGLVGGSYLDRFVVGAFLDMKAVGLTTFYTSFTTAIVTLVGTSIFSVAAPKLVDAAAQLRATEYNQELRRARFHATAFSVVLCVAISIVIPYLATAMHKPEIAENVLALWLLMTATVVRMIAETAYVGLYSRHKDRAIWIGNGAFLIVSLLLNLALVPLFGLTGLGLSSIAASAILLALRQEGLRALRP
ncbi:MAG: oligosaccharide flippase family protein [Roseiarcus sp.]